MKLRKAIKNVMALGTGLTMLGATVFGAMAAPDLGAYPSQFIESGKFNGLMVVGKAAASEDVLGVVDIATGLQFASKVETVVGTSGETTTLTGDVYQIGTSADALEIGEYLGTVKSTIGEDELGALATSQIRTSKGSTDADQYLKFNSTAGLRAVFDQNKDNVVGDYLSSANGDVMFTYELQFPEGLESSTYTTSSGTTKAVRDADETSYLNDIDDEDLFILGDTFNVVEATIDVTTSNADDIVLTLMGGALQDTLKEGETKTYEIDGKSYEVTVVIVADSGSATSDFKAKLMVNGQVTRSLSDGDTDTLDDGTVLGIKSILGNEGSEEGGADLVTFYIGANKVELVDGDFDTADFSGSSVKIDEETIEDASVDISATWQTGDDSAKITSIVYRLKADAKVSGDLYIEKDGSLRESLDEPEGLLSGEWDVKYLGLSAPETTEVALVPGADDSYTLEFVNAEGIEYSVPFVDNSNDNGLGWKFGDDEDSLVFVEGNALTSVYANATIYLDDTFIVSKAAGGDNDKGFTHVLTFDDVDITDGILSFSDLDGSDKQVTFTPFSSSNQCAAATSDLIVGGESYDVQVCTATYTDDSQYAINVDLNGDGEMVASDMVQITVKGGGILEIQNPVSFNRSATTTGIATFQVGADGLINGAAREVMLSLTTLAKYTDDNAAQLVAFNVSPATSNKVDLQALTSAEAEAQVVTDSTEDSEAFNANLTRESEKNSDLKRGLSTYGVAVEEVDASDSDDADSLSVMYPSEQVFAQVYVSGGANSAGTTSKKNTVVEYQRIQVGKSVLDSDVADWKADNLIVVGGPCANTIAAEILGISSAKPACYEDFPVQDGQGILKMVQNGDNVALLVAGYSAADTRKAAQVVANSEDYAEDLSGKSEVVISGNTIMAPQVVEETAMEEVAAEETAATE